MLRINQPDETFGPYHHHCIDIDDVDDENLLEHIPTAVKFIQSGLDAGGSVLIHWLVLLCHILIPHSPWLFGQVQPYHLTIFL